MTTTHEALREAVEALKQCRAVIWMNIEEGTGFGSSNPFFSAEVDRAIARAEENTNPTQTINSKSH